jgi:hypothetical protein
VNKSSRFFFVVMKATRALPIAMASWTAWYHITFQLLLACQLRLVHIGDDRHVVTIDVRCPIYRDTHHMELVAYTRQVLNAMFYGVNFGAKH